MKPKKTKPTAKKKPAKKTSRKKAAKKTAAPSKAAAPRSGNAAGMHDAREVVQERRYEVRTLVSNMTFAALSFNTEKFGTPGFSFSVDLSGLMVDTSVGGCSLIFMQANPLSSRLVREATCVIQIAPDAPRLATVRWVKDLDGRLRNAGFAFS